MISNIQCEEPVVGTVLDKVENGHCSMREPVHKEGFQKSLSIVQCPATCCNAETSTCYKDHTNMWTGENCKQTTRCADENSTEY